MANECSRRTFLGAALSVLSPGLAACTPWGRRNDSPSEEALAAIDSLTAVLQDVVGVDRVETRFVTHAMQEHDIFARVYLHDDLAEADLVNFGAAAHAAVLAHQVDPYLTVINATGSERGGKLHWTIVADSDPDQMPAAVRAFLAEAGRGAYGTRIERPITGDGQHVMSQWRELDESAMLAAMPGGIAQITRLLDADAVGEYSWVSVVLREGHSDLYLPYAQAVGDLEPVLSSSTTTLAAGHRRWVVKFNSREVDDPELVRAVTAFLSTLRAAGGRWDEIEFHYPWHVMLTIDSSISVSRWLDGNSDRSAAEPVVESILAAVNQR